MGGRKNDHKQKRRQEKSEEKMKLENDKMK